MRCLKLFLVGIVFAASNASNAESTKALDIHNLEAAERLWTRASLQNYQFTFKYLRHALRSKHYLVEADFDPALGYPVRAFVAWSRAADDFFSFDIINFVGTQQPAHLP